MTVLLIAASAFLALANLKLALENVVLRNEIARLLDAPEGEDGSD